MAKETSLPAKAKQPASPAKALATAAAKPSPAAKEKPAAAATALAHDFDPYDVIIHPHLAEKSMKMIELQNNLVFMVRRTASKRAIKQAVEQGFAVKVQSVRTEITRKGQKKAYVRLAPDSSAVDIATRMGMV
ncbi:MAG: 50S ribosomal protein L23 [Candidatus Aenigmarchaeota archaeon]|nr:50S ribosomal protein L23 [Candidatus Aenigmarchaeota archaeon]